MKAVRLSDLKELLAGAAFAAWWGDHGRAVAALADARARVEDLAAQAQLMVMKSELAQRAAMDAFTAAGEAEDAAVRALADGQAEENRAIERVGAYEQQRLRASDLWVRLGGAERLVEERRDALAGARDVEAHRARAEAALRQAERQHEQLQGEYAAADRARTALWEDVEASWARSFERALVGAEHGVRSRRIRRDAERLFKEAEERRARVKQLEAESELAARGLDDAHRRRRALLGSAEERFGCAAGEGFLYWGQQDDKRAAWAVPLADDPDGAQLEVKALAVYAVGRAGVALLEPAREPPPAAAARLQEYLLGVSQGAPPARADEPGAAAVKR